MIQLEASPDSLFQALSGLCRIRVMRLLYAIESEACLCELSEVLQEPEYKLSRHLKILKHAGLVETQRDGRRVYYRATGGTDLLHNLRASVLSIPDNQGTYAATLKNWQESEERCKLKKLTKDSLSI